MPSNLIRFASISPYSIPLRVSQYFGTSEDGSGLAATSVSHRYIDIDLCQSIYHRATGSVDSDSGTSAGMLVKRLVRRGRDAAIVRWQQTALCSMYRLSSSFTSLGHVEMRSPDIYL